MFLLRSIEPTTPVPSRVASQWRERPSSSSGDRNLSEMAGTPLIVRGSRTTRTTPSNYVRTTLLFGGTLLVLALGCISSSTAVLHGPLRSGTVQSLPIRLVRSALSGHVALHISASCQHMPQERPSTCTFFALRG